MKRLDIAIVGAGISGLTCALALAQSGQRVRIYEAAPAWGDVGAGITLAPNAMRGLDYVGVGEEIVRAGIEPSTQTISHWKDSSLILELDRRRTHERYGAAYVYIHRAELHKILTDAVKRAGVEMFLSKSLLDVDLEEDTPVLRFADGTAEEAGLVVGADGIKSQVRKMFATQPPEFTGHVA
ncbi:MAG: FAD-dependent oxidoreductase [Gammaproteobacteria bacterium]